LEWGTLVGFARLDSRPRLSLREFTAAAASLLSPAHSRKISRFAEENVICTFGLTGVLDNPTWLGIAIVVVFVGGWLGIASLIARKRTAALTAVAPEIGFYFQGKEWTGPQPTPPPQTDLFRRGHSKEFRNIMTGSAAGLRACLFDYRYVIGAGRNRRNIVQTVAAYSKTGVTLPEFAMQPKGILQKIGEAFRHKDINFDSHPEFSRRCQLRSPDEVRTRTVFTAALLSYLEALDPKRKWCLEGAGDTLIVYRRDKKVKPNSADCRSYLEETSTIATSFFSFGGARSGLS
jgi:hypothetical protein